MLCTLCCQAEFQSTLPARGATITRLMPYSVEKFQSTLPARGATRSLPSPSRCRNISIHAPRTGSDADARHGAARAEISIHAPRTGSDWRRASGRFAPCDFNPRSPHGERQGLTLKAVRKEIFQSTLPARGATLVKFAPGFVFRFQSTLPARGATKPWKANRYPLQNFNPRSPHGERRQILLKTMGVYLFQSTLPARGATTIARATGGGGDLFQSTLPARGATSYFLMRLSIRS